MEDEIVRKRQWVTRQQFLDMLGLTNLIPGPNSTEMAINIGFARARWLGLVVAGASFIVPAALITMAVAWVYVRFGTLPLAESLLAGVKPAVIAVIAIAVWRLGKIAVKDAWLAALGALAFAAFLVTVSPLLILAGGGVIGMLVQRVRNLQRGTSSDSTRLSTGLILLKKSSVAARCSARRDGGRRRHSPDKTGAPGASWLVLLEGWARYFMGADMCCSRSSNRGWSGTIIG